MKYPKTYRRVASATQRTFFPPSGLFGLFRNRLSSWCSTTPEHLSGCFLQALRLHSKFTSCTNHALWVLLKNSTLESLSLAVMSLDPPFARNCFPDFPYFHNLDTGKDYRTVLSQNVPPLDWVPLWCGPRCASLEATSPLLTAFHHAVHSPSLSHHPWRSLWWLPAAWLARLLYRQVVLFLLSVILWGATWKPCKDPILVQTSKADALFSGLFKESSSFVLIIYWCSKCPRFGQWESFYSGFCVLLAYSHHPLSLSLFSGTTRCFRLILYFPFPGPGISHLSKEPRFLLVQSVVWKPRFES